MAGKKSIPVYFKASDVPPDPKRLIHALHAVCLTLDEADISSAKGEEAGRISYLISAATILATQLDGMIDDLAERMEVVNG